MAKSDFDILGDGKLFHYTGTSKNVVIPEM